MIHSPPPVVPSSSRSSRWRSSLGILGLGVACTTAWLSACSESGDDGGSKDDGAGIDGAAGGATLPPGEEGILPFVPRACVPGDSFSTPRPKKSACAPPATIKTGMGGNGHSETWDGRVFLITKNTDAPPHTVGWVVRLFRPERLQKNEAGALDFSNQAFSGEVVLELNTDTNSHNALAVVPTPGFAENPFRSNEAGAAEAGGAFLTYELMIYAQNYEQESKLQARRARVVVKDPYSAEASVQSATMVDGFTLVTTKSGNHLRAIEPSISIDGRLLIAQGHPDNDGKIDYLVYSYNENPGALDGWTEFKFLSDMHTEKDTLVAGVPFGERYPIARQQLTDSAGVAYAPSEPFHGAYPWISHDGTELFFMATVAGDNDARPGERARRGGASVIGRFTNWAARHIDGPINPSRDGKTAQSTVRLFFSSPGGFTTMWKPFRENDALSMPYSARGPSYPLFGSNTGDYNEVSFEDSLDRNYVLALRMNELVNHDAEIDPTRTPDTTGQFNTGLLEGAKFPIEQNGVDEIVGAVGQALYFPHDGGVRVAHSTSFGRISAGFSAQISVKRRVDLAQDAADRAVYLLHKPGSFALRLLESGQLEASVWVGGAERKSAPFGGTPLDAWTHVAFSYDVATGALRTYVNGALEQETAGAPGALDVGTADLLVGPAGQSEAPPFVAGGTPLVLLDELTISDRPRLPEEIAASAFVCEPAAAPASFGPLPLGLRAKDLHVPADSINTEAARALGKQLFFDARLSGDEDMSCSTCHSPELAFTDARVTGLGNGKFLSRNTQSLLNRAFGATQFWDGRSASLEAQTLIPISNPDEMNLPLDQALSRLSAIPGYVEQFQTVFGRAPDAEGLEHALAAFQRSLLSGNSAVDRYENGDRSALTPEQIRGRDLFLGKGRCLGCHSGSNYSDEDFHNNGAACVGDEGLSALSGYVRDLGLFKTPTLRDVSKTAPYMHDGSLATLEAVVAAYNRGGDHRNNVDAEIFPLGLTTTEQADLVAFLKALDGAPVVVEAPALP